MSPHDLVIVGAGPAGLCAAAAARDQGWEALVLDRADRIGGIWHQVPPDLRCLSPRGHDVLPDGSLPRGPGPRATAAEVLDALERYSSRAAFDLRLGVGVARLGRSAGGGLRLETTAGPIETRRAIVASGEYGRPFLPPLPGRFSGLLQPARDVRIDEIRPGERVVVVGAGNTADDLVARLLEAGCDITVAARSLEVPPRRPPGRGIAALRWWASGIPVRFLPPRLRCRGTVPLLNHHIQRGAAAGRLRVVGPAAGYASGGLRTDDGEVVEADRIVLATGYRRELDFVEGSSLEAATGLPMHRRGLSPELPGLGFMGLPCMRTRRSGFLRGYVADARSVVARLGR